MLASRPQDRNFVGRHFPQLLALNALEGELQHIACIRLKSGDWRDIVSLWSQECLRLRSPELTSLMARAIGATLSSFKCSSVLLMLLCAQARFNRQWNSRPRKPR